MVISDKMCTGCTMCSQICPKKAISFKIKEGFRHPVVDETRCIKCKLCIDRCPAIGYKVDKNPFPIVYSAWINNSKQRKHCTSGGICYELSKYIIEQGGYVAGVAWSNNYKDAEYTIIHSLDELPRITQTKYFQPQMNNIFIKIKELLVNGKIVLFIGTSCSNAGLLSFLSKKYDNLICVDFICRGYTSQLYHQKRVEELEREYGSEITYVQYKEKSIGWEEFGTRFTFKNGESLYINRYNDPYEYMLQINDFVTRMSCFDCQYRTKERISDITLGDFWGIKGLNKEEYKNGVSAVLINSNRGEEVLEKISNVITIEERNIWQISKGNHCLLGQLDLKKGREKFYRDMTTYSIKQLHNKYGNIKKWRMDRLKRNMVRTLKEFTKLNIVKFFYLNFICKEVTRYKKAYILPYRGSRIRIDKGSKVEVRANLYLNAFKNKGSREESFLNVYQNGTFIINGRVRIASGSTIDILPDGELLIGQSDTNHGAVIVCSNMIHIGDGVEMGRNVIIYDSNYHPTQFNKNIKGRPLIIGDHVWLCTGVCIAKGLTIGSGSICGINSTVVRNVKERTSVLGNPAKCIMENVEW